MTSLAVAPVSWDSHASTLYRVALAAARPSSPELFEELVGEMVGCLGASAGFVAVFTDETRTKVRTLAALLDAKALSPFEYALAGTPCEQVVGSEFRHVVRGVAEEFRASSLFAAKGMDSYAAYPLCDSHGERLGLLGAMDRQPLADPALAEAVLKIIGSRIAAELERSTTEGVLKTAALAVSSARGATVFAELVQSLAAILQVDAAFIARPSIATPGTMEVLAMQLDGAPVDGGCYDVQSGPCAGVLAEGFRIYPERLGDFFPDEPMVHAHRFEAYAGYPLTDLTGITLGVVATASRVPMRRLERIESVMQIFAVRAAAEIERLRADEALRKSEESYRTIFESIEDAVIIRDWHTFALVDLNPKACEMSGFRREDVLGSPLALFCSRDAPYTEADARRHFELAREGRRPPYEWRVWRERNCDGTFSWFEVRLKPVKIGGVPRMLSLSRDITEQKNAEEALRLREEQYRAIFEASSDAFVLRDAELRILDANPAFLQLYRVTREQLTAGGGYPERFPSGDVAERRERIERALQGQESHVETKAMRPDGTTFEADLRVIPVRYRGEPHVLSVVRDITARREAEKQRAELESQLRQAQKMEAIGQLTGGIAHDFNNILTSVTGYVILASERAERLGAKDLVRQLGQAHLAAQRAGDLISQMLAFARQQRSERRPLALALELGRSAQLLRSTMPSSVDLHTAFDGTVPAIVGDSVQIEQVLFNLCINARDAIRPTGAIRIGLGSASLDGVCASCRAPLHGGWVVLSVADTGTGVSDAVRERMFEPFFTTKSVGGGSGMGLAMVHGIVHDHGGHVLVDSVAPHGTRFRVLLPPASAAPPGDLGTAPGVSPPTLSGRILLVEDEAMVAAFMTELLEGWGFEVTHCGDPMEAEHRLASPGPPFDLVLTDQTMPGLTGVELAKRLGTLRPGLPVLLYSGFGDGIDADELGRSGVRAVLTKPIEPASLRSALADALGVSARA